MLREKDLVIAVAKEVDAIGGKMYNVGGYVRDELLGITCKDIDVEVHGITPSQLKSILSKYGEVNEVGASFGVLMIKGFDIDFTMPRTETKIGESHKGFDISIDPFMGTFCACSRRDFTLNSILKNILTDEIIDHFNGIRHLEQGLITHVDSITFIEDPLRVFRACQFASRFNFQISPDTLKLCSQIDITSLPRERVLKELEKAILKSEKSSIFFTYLKKMGKLRPFFNELDDLDYKTFEFVINYIDKLEHKSLESVLSIICYFIDDVDIFLNRFTNETNLIKNIKQNAYILNQLPLDLDIVKMRNFAYLSVKKEALIKDIVKATTSDSFFNIFDESFDLAINDVKIPLVTSNDLFQLGHQQGKDFGDKLKLSMELQVKGFTKEEILKEI